MYPEAFRCQYTGLVPKLGAQIKGELMQNKISHLISSMQMRLQILRHLSKTLTNVQFKALYMCEPATQVCLNLSQCTVCIKESNISLAPVCPK